MRIKVCIFTSIIIFIIQACGQRAEKPCRNAGYAETVSSAYTAWRSSLDYMDSRIISGSTSQLGQALDSLSVCTLIDPEIMTLVDSVNSAYTAARPRTVKLQRAAIQLVSLDSIIADLK